MKVWPAVLLGVLAAASDGCAPTAKVARERILGMNDVVRNVSERNGKIRTMRGDGTITVESPEASNSGSFEMAMRKPDSVRVEISGPFGIHAGTLLLSRDRFLFYNWMNNTALVGKPDGRTMSSVLHLRLGFDEVLHAFSGEFPGPASGDSLEGFSIDNGYYLLRYRSREGRKEYRVDGDAFVVSSYRMLDTAGTLRLSMIATRIEDEDGIAMPTLLRVIMPAERRSVTVSYDDVSLNEPVVCLFTLPKKAEVIER